MPTLVGNGVNETQYSGTAPLAPAHATFTFPAGAAAGDKVRLLVLPGNTKVLDVRLINAALGAGTTLSLGYDFTDTTLAGGNSANAILAATPTAAAANTRMANAPVTVPSEFYLTATLAGGAASGKIDVVVFYRFLG